MQTDYKRLTDFLVQLGTEQIAHSNKNYLAHLIGVYRLMESENCTPELCRAGMFHSIYGTELFQGFKLAETQRAQVRDLIGERAEYLAHVNCFMDRASFDRAAQHDTESYCIIVRPDRREITLSRRDFDDLCRVHLYDWLEQVPRSELGWGYRRAAFRRMADRVGPPALDKYQQVFTQEPVTI